MVANCFILIASIFFCWLAYKFKLKTAVQKKEVILILPVFAFFILVLAFNLLLAYMGYQSLKHAATITPLDTVEDLSFETTGAGVLIHGTISPSNPPLYQNYIAYVDETHLWSPDSLLIRLTDGDIAVTNDYYSIRNWPIDAMDYAYLSAGQSVTVVGQVERSIPMLGDNKEEILSIHADIIYVGLHEDFIQSATQKSLIPRILMYLNLIGILVIIGVICFYWMTRGSGNEKALLKKERS